MRVTFGKSIGHPAEAESENKVRPNIDNTFRLHIGVEDTLSDKFDQVLFDTPPISIIDRNDPAHAEEVRREDGR